MGAEFVHLHVHTDLSVLDGLSKPEAYIERAKQLGQPALAITDHGNLSGLPEFYFEARKQEVEPILGCEFYFVPDIPAHKESKAKATEDDGSRYHLTVLAKGAKGYQALTELSTESYRNFYYKPLIDHKVLAGADLEHLVVLSGCASSVLSKLALDVGVEAARTELDWWARTCPNFFIELQHHATEFDWRLNSLLYELARKHKLPWVITNDPHYVDADECDYHDVLLAVGTQAKLDDPNRMRFDGAGYWLKSRSEMKQAWRDYEAGVVKAGLDTSSQIAWACKTRIPGWEKRGWLIPQYKKGKDSFVILNKLVLKALKRRGHKRDDVYWKQAQYELDIIKQAGIADFLLITRDAIRWAIKRGIPVGPGRGSVCGCLVAYLVGIHKVDPIRYKLLFERFLNPARPSMPDIDTDFGQERRKEMFAYVIEKYGKENVMHVGTFQRKKLRGMFNSLAKANGVPFNISVEISKKIPDDAEADQIELLIKENPILHNSPGFVDQLRKLAGVRSGFGQHPAGVIIAPPEHKVYQHVPQMMIGSSKQWIAAYDLEALEHLGYLKEDFLGLRTLETIQEAVSLIKQHHGIELDPDSWVPDEEEGDEDVYAMLAAGDTAGVFQLEGGTNTRGIQQIGCRSFEDIVSCTALFRTGPIVAGFPDQFVENRSTGEPAYLDPGLAPILARTEGVILYQEQVMDIGAQLAGFDMARVDDLKEAIKHKKSKLMESMKPAFLKGCKKNKVKNAGKIWEQIEGYSGYSYNRSHAVAYSLLSYQTARLKRFWPAEFYAALLRTVDEKDKRTRYLNQLVRKGFKVYPPEVNRAERFVTPVYKDDEPVGVRFGLQDIAGVGPTRVKRLLNAAPFNHPGQVADLVDQGTYRALLNSGALRRLGLPGDKAQRDELLGYRFKDKMKRYRDIWETELVRPGDGEILDDDKGYSEVLIAGELVGVEVKSVKQGQRKGQQYLVWDIMWEPGTNWPPVMLWTDTENLMHCWWVPVGRFVKLKATWQPEFNNITVPSRQGWIQVLDRGIWIPTHKGEILHKQRSRKAKKRAARAG